MAVLTIYQHNTIAGNKHHETGTSAMLSIGKIALNRALSGAEVDVETAQNRALSGAEVPVPRMDEGKETKRTKT